MHLLGHECVSADNAAATNHRAIKDGGSHADEAVVLHRAGMQNRAVAHRHEVADDDGQILSQMDDATILEVRALADFNVVDVTAKDCHGPDAGPGSKADVAHDDSVRRNIGGRVDARLSKKKTGAMTFVHGVSFTLQMRLSSRPVGAGRRIC